MKLMVVLGVEAAAAQPEIAAMVTRLLARPGVLGCASSVRLDIPGAFKAGLGTVFEVWMDDCIHRPEIARCVDDVSSAAGVLTAAIVDEVEPVAIPTPLLGLPVPGLRLLSLCHRRAGMTPQAFSEYWLGPHAAVALSYAVALVGYQQNVVVEHLRGQPIDGIASLHFASFEHFQQRYAGHPEDAARGAADAAVFLDDTRVGAFTSLTVYREPLREAR